MEAVVATGDFEIRYRRAGRGPAVILLLTGSGPDDDDGILRELAADYCVVQPSTADGPDAAAVEDGRWLRGLIDGLGLERPLLVVDAGWLAHAKAYARVDPERVRGVVAMDSRRPARAPAPPGEAEND